MLEFHVDEMQNGRICLKYKNSYKIILGLQSYSNRAWEWLNPYGPCDKVECSHDVHIK